MSFLPSDGDVKLSWKEARPEGEGKLFYAAEMLSQISVSPGLMRQVGLLDFKIMQGEMSRVALVLHGAGEVTRVAGRSCARVERGADDEFGGSAAGGAIQPAAEGPVFVAGADADAARRVSADVTDAMQVRPDGATRFAGYVRIVNEGAVRLEVAQASGMSQISPEQFPESDSTRAVLRATGGQRFAYRFSGADFALKIQADQILPELAVSEVLTYNLGENELAIDAEIELDIREAPLRELLLRVPKGYVVAPPKASGMSDYFLRDTDDGQRCGIAIGVWRSRFPAGNWCNCISSTTSRWARRIGHLPRVEVMKAKSVRGFVGVSADAGFRLTPGRTQRVDGHRRRHFSRAKLRASRRRFV